MIKLKFVDLKVLIKNDEFLRSSVWNRIIADLKESIADVKWPKGSDKFLLFDDKGRGRGQANGVTPIKRMFQNNLKARGWDLERKCILQAINLQVRLMLS